MTDESDLQPRVTAGEAADRLLQSEDYKLAVVEAQTRVMRAWASTEPQHHELRNTLYYEMRALQHVDLALRLRAEDGQVAKSMLGQFQAKMKKMFA